MGVVRTTIGTKSKKGDMRQGSFSKRVAKGKLEVIKTKKAKCPNCGHNKFLDTLSGKTKCSRCKMRVTL